MSDLLTRQIVDPLQRRRLLRADIKTRYDVYKLAVESGVMTAEQAAVIEGILPGDVENAPMPFGAPQAVPSSLPIQRVGRHALHLVRQVAGRGGRLRHADPLPALQAPERGVIVPLAFEPHHKDHLQPIISRIPHGDKFTSPSPTSRSSRPTVPSSARGA